MSPSITIKPATYQDAEPIANIQIAGWRASYKDIIPQSHLNNLSVGDKVAFWQSILIDPKEAENILVARRNENDSADQTGQPVLGFVTFGSADEESGSGSVAEMGTGASRRGELRAIYVNPQHLSEGVGRSLWTAAQKRLVGLGYSDVVVSVFAGNERATRFYRKAGFTEGKTGQTTVGGAVVATLQLIKRL